MSGPDDPEPERSDAETGRSNAEAERSNAEAGRSDAEAERSNAEAGRSDAEAGRSDAEAERSNAETGRSDTGTERSSSETAQTAPQTARATPASERTAADLLARCLEREGVEHVFGVPGEEIEDLLFSLRDSAVTFVPTRHEQGAAFMADVNGRVTGEAGVCLSTLGPGATNLLTGVADAHLDKSPLVAITAQGGLERLHRESHQAIDVLDTFESVTKWNAQLDDPDIVHEAARKAFKLAELEKPGATHLELPEDVAGEPTDRRPLERVGPVPGAAPNPDATDRVVSLFRSAERPLIVAGNGTVRTDAWRELRQLVANADVPVVSTYMGKGAVSDRNPQSLMTLASGEGGSADVLARADLLVAVGYDIAEHDPADWAGATDAPIVHVDSEPAEVHQRYDPAVELVADVELALRELVDRVIDETAFRSDWYGGARERLESLLALEPDPEPPLSVADVLPLLRDAMAPEDVLVSDVGSHKLAIAEQFPTYEPNTTIVSNGLASMGIAVPGALAADLALDANVVAATGDGGFLMNAGEIETATRLGCGYTIVVFRDDDYGMISAQQEASRGERFGTALTNPDLQAFAESFGIDAYRADSASDLRDALEVVAEDRMALVEVPLV